MQAKRFFFEKKKQKTFIHCRRHGVRTENSVPSETGKSFLVLFCKKERVALLRFQWVDLPGQLPFFQKELLFEMRRKNSLSVTWWQFVESGKPTSEVEVELLDFLDFEFGFVDPGAHVRPLHDRRGVVGA